MTTSVHRTQLIYDNASEYNTFSYLNFFLTKLSNLLHFFNISHDSAQDKVKNHSGYSPISAKVIFARGASPLYLPKLDSLLLSFPAPQFDIEERYNLSKAASYIFPPLDSLANTGKTIADLETNSVLLPFWKDRNSIFGSFTNLFLAIAGSSVVATFYNLYGLVDTVQIFALLLGSILPLGIADLDDKWRMLFLGTIPNVLAMNFGSAFTQSILFFIVLLIIALLLLYYFRKSTDNCVDDTDEGLWTRNKPTRHWKLLFTTFILTILYLPISSITVRALLWSDDFWAIPNPYINATSNPPVVAPLGPSDIYRDPLDFCYTTTMRKDEVNFAPVIVLSSFITFFSLTVWFPLRLRQVISRSTPIVGKYTELGRLRSRSDADREYQRLLDRDHGPLVFLYDGFRRGWGTYRSFYLFVKLSALLLVAVINPDNCLFRTLPRNYVSDTQQALLVLTMLAFLMLQCFLAPFINPVNNASEWISRLNYVLTALIGLAVSLKIPGYMTLNTVVLYIVYASTYGLGVYFTIVNTTWMRKVIKRLTKRLDFSVDIFSPRLDISESSIHANRRIWQEAISTLFLTSRYCKIPKEQLMIFLQSRNSEYPPYLLNFKGSPAERHVENLKILREVGSEAYERSLDILCCQGNVNVDVLENIQRDFIGPDCYWCDPEEVNVVSSANYFGNAWWIPFPPTLIIHFDDGRQATLSRMHDFDLYVTQNRSAEIRRKRELRMALRALDGMIVQWPYKHQKSIGRRKSPSFLNNNNYRGETIIRFETCLFRIIRRGSLVWNDYQLGSGFDLELFYAKDCRLDGSVIGVTYSYDLTADLAQFLYLNRHIINRNIGPVEEIIRAYRTAAELECRAKIDTLSYTSLSSLYNNPQNYEAVVKIVEHVEQDLRVRQLFLEKEVAVQISHDRFAAVTRSPVSTWWYIFWDDMWRRNYETNQALQRHFRDFNPHYSGSIAYRPLPRSALESFLCQRGLMTSGTSKSFPIHSGLLNKIYLRMYEIAFRGTGDAIHFHLGSDTLELNFDSLVSVLDAQPSTLGTGGGTDHDDESIRARPIYQWEGILDDPISKHKPHKAKWIMKLGTWFGITPLWRRDTLSKGLSLDLILEDGRYRIADVDLE